jgi:hypothetical protein
MNLCNLMGQHLNKFCYNSMTLNTFQFEVLSLVSTKIARMQHCVL